MARCSPTAPTERVDLLVFVSGGTDLAPLAAAARRLKGRLQSQNRGADIFLATRRVTWAGSARGEYANPGSARMRRAALWATALLHDDLATIRLDSSLIAAPPLQLWPTVVRRAEIPGDVEALARRLSNRITSRFT